MTPVTQSLALPHPHVLLCCLCAVRVGLPSLLGYFDRKSSMQKNDVSAFKALFSIHKLLQTVRAAGVVPSCVAGVWMLTTVMLRGVVCCTGST